MEDLDKLGKLRKPPEPFPRVGKARMARHKELLDEFFALKKLAKATREKVYKPRPDPRSLDEFLKAIDTPLEEMENPAKEARAEYARRLPLYIAAREAYIKENEGRLETIEKIRRDVRHMKRQSTDRLNDENYWEWQEIIFDEANKFAETEDEAGAVFQGYVAARAACVKENEGLLESLERARRNVRDITENGLGSLCRNLDDANRCLALCFSEPKKLSKIEAKVREVFQEVAKKTRYRTSARPFRETESQRQQLDKTGERNQMTIREELDKLGKLRMPLEPLPPANGVADEAHRARLTKYKELMAEFSSLKGLQELSDALGASEATKEQAKEEYARRLPLYIAARAAYIEANEGFLETIETVRANIRRINDERTPLDRTKYPWIHEGADDWVARFNAACEEENKFKEIEDEAEAVFQKVAKMTLAKRRIDQ